MIIKEFQINESGKMKFMDMYNNGTSRGKDGEHDLDRLIIIWIGVKFQIST